MKAIAYTRVSTEGQVEDGVSLDAQEAKLRAWAELNGAESFEVFTDAGVSGKRADNRPGLQAALEAVAPGDALVVYSLSRLARSTRDTLEVAERLERRGADLVSLNERIDTTSASGKMLFRLLAVLAEFERDQVSERTRMALAHKRGMGQKLGGDVAFGFRLDSGRLIPEEREQSAVKLMCRLRKRGRSLRDIARALERQGYLTRRGLTRWNPKTIAAVIGRNLQKAA